MHFKMRRRRQSGKVEGDMKIVIGWTAVALLLATSTVCNAQSALKQEPMMMNRGTVVLVDDGSCPRGKIKEVSTQLATGVITNPYGAVARRCIPSRTGEAAAAIGR
jgi:hypothetical protein